MEDAWKISWKDIADEVGGVPSVKSGELTFEEKHALEEEEWSKLLEEYMSRIEEACGEGGDFIVILRYAKKDESVKRILEKCDIEQTFSRVLTKCRYKGKEVSVFLTGKLIIKD
ncbi:MAG: hypothetical protein AOA65_1146 [Candidatus Bathyarchaeota archaeon BA1]|nr:MAG: hypothetical protein AOA65_1146 [Candidatus Bathyarchaeota archaeon BA1]